MNILLNFFLLWCKLVVLMLMEVVVVEYVGSICGVVMVFFEFV